MLAFNWKFLTPLSLVVLSVTAVGSKLLAGSPTWLSALGLFLANLVIAWLTIVVLRGVGRRQRRRDQQHASTALPLARHGSE